MKMWGPRGRSTPAFPHTYIRNPLTALNTEWVLGLKRPNSLIKPPYRLCACSHVQPFPQTAQALDDLRGTISISFAKAPQTHNTGINSDSKILTPVETSPMEKALSTCPKVHK